MTLRDDLDRMDREDKAATPGPWYAVDGNEKVGPKTYNKAAYASGGRLSDDDGDGSWTVSTMPKAAGWDTDGGYSSYALAEPEANWIASARTDRPALVKMVRSLIESLVDITEGRFRKRDFDEIWEEAKRKAGVST